MAGQDVLKAEPVMHASSCDRECLRGFITKYLDARIAHKPGDLPVSNNSRFTENTADITLGKGTWKTACIRMQEQAIAEPHIPANSCGIMTSWYVE